MILLHSDWIHRVSNGKNIAIALYPFVVVRKHEKITETLLNHEKIHLRQQVECLIVPFYLVYLINYIVQLIRYKNHQKAYLNISFEREAYHNDHNPNYLQKRPPYGWIAYLFTKR